MGVLENHSIEDIDISPSADTIVCVTGDVCDEGIDIEEPTVNVIQQHTQTTDAQTTEEKDGDESINFGTNLEGSDIERKSQMSRFSISTAQDDS